MSSMLLRFEWRDRGRAVLASVAFAVAACGGDDGGEGAVPEDLVGMYEADLVDAAGTITISVGADRSFLITRPGHRPFSIGPITVDADELVVSPDEFGDCADRGT
jgi:hypothetical protein